MAIYNGFDINTAATPKPWGAREEQAIKDIIDTLVGDSIAGAKATGGHEHNTLYASAGVSAIDVDGSGNVGIGGTPGNKLDIITGVTTDSSVHIGEVADEGGYITSYIDHHLGLGGGVELVSNAWTARSTVASLINLYNGEVQFFTDSGLTDGNTYSPTNRMTISSAGVVNIVGTATINDLDVTTNIDTATMTATGTVGVNDLNVTTNIDTATLIATGTVGVNDLDVTTNIDTATMTATGTVGVNDLDVTTNIDTATMTATGTVGVNDLDVTTNIDTATLRTTSTVGIGIASPDGTCHIHTGSAGTVTAAAADLVVESNATCGITILSPDAFLSLLEFGTPTDNTSAELRWDYTNTLFSLWTDIAGGEIVLGTGTQNEAVRIDSSGNVGINVTTPSALLDVNGTSEFNGAIGVGANLISYNGGASTTGLSFNSSDIGNITNTALAVGDSHVSLTFVDNTALAAGVGGGINFQGVYTAGGATNNFAGIKGVKANGTDGNYSGQLHFQTRLNGSTAATNMIIDESGLVGIGTTTPGNKLDIITGATTSSGFHLGEADNEGFYITSTSDSEGVFGSGAEYVSGSWYARATSAAFVYMGNGAMSFIADTGLTDGNTFTATTRMTLYSDGGLYMAGATGGSQGSGTINATAVYDDGSGPLTDYVFEKHYDENYVVPEDNEPAKTFELRYEICKSLDSFISFVKGKKCLPAFDNGGERLPIGTGHQKLLETVETLVYHLDSINSRLKVLEAA